MRVFRVFGIVALAAMLLPALSYAKGPKVAVMDFDYGTVQRWWSNDYDVGKGISDLLVDELVNDGTYSVYERKILDKLLAEQDFSNSDRADSATAVKLGKMAGVQAMITGSITTFGFDSKNIGVSGGGWGGGGFGIGSVGTKKDKAVVQITARLIDVKTGEILGSAKAKGESKRSGLLLGGVGGGGAGGGATLDIGSSNFQETILGEATNAAVTQLKDQLIKFASRVE
ncbi:MAG: CsgG/HfaB family protein [Acidobacteriota bacterium]